MINTNDHWSRAHELGNATRKVLATANTGGIGILLALGGSLAADGVSPDWAVPAVAAFAAGVIFVVVGYLLAEHRAIEQAKAPDGQYPKFAGWKWGILWNSASLLCLLAGAFLGLRGLNAVQVPGPDETDEEAPAPAVDTVRADAGKKSGYGAIIDAGSTGSRLWIFKWSTHAGSDPIVEIVDNLKGKTAAGDDCPLTTMISDEPGTCTCLKNLLLQGHQKLATAAGAAATGIPLWLKATGGVRKTPMKDQIDILTRTDRCLKPETHYSWRGAEAIAGSTEALYAWIAVNYARNTLQSDTTFGIAEIGGESAQVAFEVRMAIAPTQRGSVAAVPLSSGTRYVYGYSDVLGREALRRYFTEKKISVAECAQEADHERCLERIDHFLCGKLYAGKPCPQRVAEFAPDRITFVGLSNFDFAVFNSGFDQGSLLDVRKRVETACGPGTQRAALRKQLFRPGLPEKFEKEVCLNALYTTQVAQYGWNLPLDAVTRSNAGPTPEWPLGAMFLEIARHSKRTEL